MRLLFSVLACTACAGLYAQIGSIQDSDSLNLERALPYEINYEQLAESGNYGQEPDFGILQFNESGVLDSQAYHRLFPEYDSVPIFNIWSMEQVYQVAFNKYFTENSLRIISKLALRKKAYAIVIEEENYDGVKATLHTFNKKNRPVDQRIIAFYTHTGSATGEDGQRIPFWSHRSASINAEYVLTIYRDYGQQSVDAEYMLRSDGRIEQIK